jgi:hypothetical protein
MYHHVYNMEKIGDRILSFLFANLKRQDVVVVGALHPEHLHRLGMAWNSGYDMV